jgi:hypothetical protein
MGSKSDAWEVDVLKMVTGQASTLITSTAFTTVPVKLFTANPTDSSNGTEVTGGSYAQVDSKSKWAAPTSGAGTCATNAVLTYPTASADWSSGSAVTGFAVCNSTPVQLMWGALTTSKTVLNGDTPSFASGALVLTED